MEGEGMVGRRFWEVFGDFQNDNMRSSTNPVLGETTIADENYYLKQPFKVTLNYPHDIQQRKKYLINLNKNIKSLWHLSHNHSLHKPPPFSSLWDQQDRSPTPSGHIQVHRLPTHPAPGQALKYISRRFRSIAYLISAPLSAQYCSLCFRKELLEGCLLPHNSNS